MDNVGAIDRVDSGDAIGPIHDDGVRSKLAMELLQSHFVSIEISARSNSRWKVKHRSNAAKQSMGPNGADKPITCEAAPPHCLFSPLKRRPSLFGL